MTTRHFVVFFCLVLSPTHLKSPDSVIPFPYGSNIRFSAEGKLETYLTIMSAMAVDAATLVQKNTAGKIIIPGETPFEDLDSTTKLMATRAEEQGVSPDSIVRLEALKDGRRLNNTYLQAEGLAEKLAIDSNPLVIALDYHMARLKGAVKAFGILASFRTVESIFQENGVLKYNIYYPVTAKLRRSELMARIITNGIGLPKGQIPNYMVRLLGARVVDIHPTEDDELTIENDLVRRKRKKLEAQGFME